MSADTVDDGVHVFRVTHNQSGDHHLQVCKDGAFFSLYRFELAQYGQADCELGHFYSHRHPDASFVKHLVVALLLENETRSLRDLTYRVIKNSNSKDHEIGTAEQLKTILIDELGIQITADESDSLFDKLKQRHG